MGHCVPDDADAELVQQLKAGKFPRGDLDNLFGKIKGWIYTEHRPFFGEADDLATEAIEAAYRGIDDFKGDSLFFTWVMGIVTVLIKNRSTKRKQKPEQLLEDFMAAAGHTTEHKQAQQRQAVDQEDKQILKWEIQAFRSNLDDRTRRIFELRHDMGMSSREISGIVGERDDNIRAILSRTHNKLMQTLIRSGYAHLVPRPSSIKSVAAPELPNGNATHPKSKSAKGAAR